MTNGVFRLFTGIKSRSFITIKDGAFSNYIFCLLATDNISVPLKLLLFPLYLLGQNAKKGEILLSVSFNLQLSNTKMRSVVTNIEAEFRKDSGKEFLHKFLNQTKASEIGAKIHGYVKGRAEQAGLGSYRLYEGNGAIANQTGQYDQFYGVLSTTYEVNNHTRRKTLRSITFDFNELLDYKDEHIICISESNDYLASLGWYEDYLSKLNKKEEGELNGVLIYHRTDMNSKKKTTIQTITKSKNQISSTSQLKTESTTKKTSTSTSISTSKQETKQQQIKLKEFVKTYKWYFIIGLICLVLLLLLLILALCLKRKRGIAVIKNNKIVENSISGKEEGDDLLKLNKIETI